jgi:antitoxin CptB
LNASGQILWRCRRGTKELDVLLERYLRHGYPQAGAAERAAFEQILDLPDPLLADYLFGHATPAQPQLAELVHRIAPHRA